MEISDAWIQLSSPIGHLPYSRTIPFQLSQIYLATLYSRSSDLTDLDYKHKHTKEKKKKVYFICLLHCPKLKTFRWEMCTPDGCHGSPRS